MADSLTIFGTTYTGVTGIIATDTNSTDKTYIRPQGTKSISANGTGIDVTEYASVNVNVPSGGSSNTFVVHLSKVNDVWTPDCTYSQLYEAYQAGKEIVWEASDPTITLGGMWDDASNCFNYAVWENIADDHLIQKIYLFSSDGLSKDGDFEVYATYSANAYPSDVAQGKVFYNKNGKQIGTASSAINNQDKTVTPTTSQQSITADTGYTGLGTVTVEAMPSGSATGPTSLSASSATVIAGTNTLTLTKSGVSTTPTVSAGYISSATSSSATVTLMASVTTKAAATITPTKSSQTIAANTYLKGVQTIAAIPAQYITTTDATATSSDILSGETAYVNGSKVTGNLVVQHYYTGSSAPSSSLGSNGDIYIQA